MSADFSELHVVVLYCRKDSPTGDLAERRTDQVDNREQGVTIQRGNTTEVLGENNNKPLVGDSQQVALATLDTFHDDQEIKDSASKNAKLASALRATHAVDSGVHSLNSAGSGIQQVLARNGREERSVTMACHEDITHAGADDNVTRAAPLMSQMLASEADQNSVSEEASFRGDGTKVPRSSSLTCSPFSERGRGAHIMRQLKNESERIQEKLNNKEIGSRRRSLAGRRDDKLSLKDGDRSPLQDRSDSSGKMMPVSAGFTKLIKGTQSTVPGTKVGARQLPPTPKRTGRPGVIVIGDDVQRELPAAVSSPGERLNNKVSPVVEHRDDSPTVRHATMVSPDDMQAAALEGSSLGSEADKRDNELDVVVHPAIGHDVKDGHVLNTSGAVRLEFLEKANDGLPSSNNDGVVSSKLETNYHAESNAGQLADNSRTPQQRARVAVNNFDSIEELRGIADGESPRVEHSSSDYAGGKHRQDNGTVMMVHSISHPANAFDGIVLCTADTHLEDDLTKMNVGSTVNNSSEVEKLNDANTEVKSQRNGPVVGIKNTLADTVVGNGHCESETNGMIDSNADNIRSVYTSVGSVTLCLPIVDSCLPQQQNQQLPPQSETDTNPASALPDIQSPTSQQHCPVSRVDSPNHSQLAAQLPTVVSRTLPTPTSPVVSRIPRPPMSHVPSSATATAVRWAINLKLLHLFILTDCNLSFKMIQLLIY